MVSETLKQKHSVFVAGSAVFAFVWVVARACVQSVTIDEADTYLYSVLRPGPSPFNPSANNHVLNSLLMRLVTTIFGASALTLRLPALLGAGLFIAAVYFLARLLTRSATVQWALLVCLTCSPFVMDYLVAARGYSLASAFLLWPFVLAAWYKAGALPLGRACVWISVSAGLCICANFSFAIADAFTVAGVAIWIAWDRRQDWGRILLALTLPGLAVAYFFVGSVVLGWPKGQFTWGADSLGKTVRSLVSASLFEPNDSLLNPRLHHYFVHFGPFLYPLLAAIVLWRVAMVAMERASVAMAAIAGGALLLAVAAHQFLYAVYGILLPLDRTAMWVALLFFVTAGALAAAPLVSGAGRASGQALAAILVLIACYNIGCLRLTYFNEWKYDADMKNVYAVLADYNHHFGITKVSANWRYVAALNCYRTMSGRETIEPISSAPSVVNYYPPGYDAYVVYYAWDKDFLDKEGLKLVYQDPGTDVAIAVRPALITH